MDPWTKEAFIKGNRRWEFTGYGLSRWELINSNWRKLPFLAKFRLQPKNELCGRGDAPSPLIIDECIIRLKPGVALGQQHQRLMTMVK